ncbi:MAG: RluA family pseudouridine synthase [Myxococcales bacterium]|nr:RluA family pseudouridine synthase [Myxococcales bacterium]
MESKTWTAEAAGRLDAAVKQATGESNSVARRAIRTGKVSVGGVRQLDPGFAVAAGATIAVEMAAPNPARTEPFGLRLVYRDDWLVIVDKPAGLLSTPTHANEEETALHGAQMLCKGGGRAVKVVHRLDRETSGLLVFARGVPAARAMRGEIESRSLRRIYRCIVAGVPERAEGLVSSMLLDNVGGTGKRGSRPGTLKVRDRRQPDPGPMPGAGRLAVTRYRVVAQTEHRAALEVKLSTGRTHQIRIHLAEMGHPVLGERIYAREESAPRQALHAASVALAHPESGERLQFQSPWPADLAGVHPRGRGW